MAEQGSMDELLSTEIDQNKVSALVGSLESQLSSSGNKESHKVITSSSYNNNHIGGNASLSMPSSRPILPNSRPQHSATNVHNLGVGSQPSGVVQKLIPQAANLTNPSLKGSINNPQIIGISSIINSNSQNHQSLNRSSPSSVQNIPPLTATSAKNVNISPSIRIVTNNSTKPLNAGGNQLQTSNTQFNSAMSQGVTLRPQQGQALNRVNISASGASNAIHNLATIAAEAKPLTVLPNGSTHLQNIPHKDGSVISQQIVLKNDINNSVKRDVGPQTKGDIPMSTSVIQGVRQDGNPNISTGHQQIRVSANPNVVTVRTHTPQSQQHVVVRTTLATTVANTSPSVQVVNASQAGAPSTLRPGIAPHQMRPGQVRIPNPVRIAAPPNIAPRQATSQPGTITIPQGSLLMRNSSGQFVLVSAPQSVLQQSPSSNSVISTVATPGGYRVQNVRPVSSQAPVRVAASTGQTIVTIQPQGTTQPQLRGPNSVAAGFPRPMGPNTTHQRPGAPTQAVSQPVSTTIGQPPISAPAVGTMPIEMNKCMLDNVKKCKNFLSTLIKLAHSQPADTVRNVQALIQGLIDGKVEPEVFTERLQQELQSSPQPYLVPFLKKSLPLLRQSMLSGTMTIEGVRPPTVRVPPTVAAPPVVATPATTVVHQQVITAGGTLTTRPVVTTQPPQPQVRPVTCPVRSKVATVRHSIPQVAITPGGNKVVVHATPPGPRGPITTSLGSQPTTHAQVGYKLAGPRQLQQVVRAQQQKGPISSLPATLAKPAPSSPAPGHREKRKFETIKDGDDDINDVATMGGVNLSEESKNILATTNADSIGAQMRSCKDEIFLASQPLLRKITEIAKKYGIEEIQPSVVSLISHAAQERLRDLTSKLSVIAEHRVEMFKMDPRYEVESENKQKLKFLEELDKLEKKRHEEHEREILLRAYKSRSKNEDPEQLKLKQKAKELQQAEAEELRQKEANLTALAAIGPRKKRKLDLSGSASPGSSNNSNSLLNSAGSSRPNLMRPRIKRVNMRDLQFVLENERSTKKSELLYKTFLK